MFASSIQITAIAKPKKPSACNPCKARRVLCHPQPGGAACPRCMERKIICTTTPVPRGRPRKNPPKSSLSLSALPQPTHTILSPVGSSCGFSPDCPDLSPEFVSHCFDGLEVDFQYWHPLITATSIKSDIRAVSCQLHLLSPQSYVLALCIVAYASLTSFHEFVLGEGPRPDSYKDLNFFSSRQELLRCGVRRAPAYRALRTEALKAALDACTILLPSNENAASCYLLDLMDQVDFCNTGRPFATAYMAHLRVLAPTWWPSSKTALTFGGFVRWTGALLMESLISTRKRTPLLVTSHDQLFLCGPEPPPLEILLDSLESSEDHSIVPFRWATLRPYLFHFTTLARHLDGIAGDFARTRPLNEGAILNLLKSLSTMHSIISLLLDRIERAGAPAVSASPFYRELQYRENSSNCPSPNPRVRERLATLRTQAHELVVLGQRELARGIRRLPKIHYLPAHGETIRAWAEFAAEEADAHAHGDASPLSAEVARDLETYANELRLLGYSIDVASTPQTSALIERLENHVDRAIVSLFLPGNGT
ncbi:Zn(2)-C6 fungal-type domain-containing protein [Mycena venus]|uniref:Zn(2)-C6 fungal-type domain-containing protein n=1 Tax=Mycena venus TaxID=2733690 RepID=A0A8H7D0N2_9AGAR|nr:Zn(2)-C6 fungal-type domain-containing protein [Mycena venus]